MPATATLQNAQQNRQAIKQAFDSNNVDVYALNDAELLQLWMAIGQAKGKNRQQIESDFNALTSLKLADAILAFGVNYGSSVADGKVLAALATDMKRGGSILGKYQFKVANGKRYIVFKGYSGLRRLITGTRYLSDNAKLMQLGITESGVVAGVKNGVKSGVLITLVFSVTLNTIDWIFKDDYHWSNWLGTLSTDITKAAIASTAGYLASAATVAASVALTGATIAVLPLAAGILVGVLVGVALNAVDEKFQITQSLINALDTAQRRIQNSIDNNIAQAKRGMLDGVYYLVHETGNLLRRSARHWINDQISGLLRRLGGFSIY
ncbi:hypothetical protein [Gallaecimonas pentaromativorans]|uniref:Uncharacterized protein n=1 Tax=Gallaecimonas pentaromativorans TaxID=584787 RepID=A0A3N1PNX1_9GAMM|nr:hypothetical protein [Gallaecimonas pentaromativorans]ROQ28580.1 hypothetical protein EDC28_103173 [Gallaecimonas pentaromativorans]